MVSSLRKFLYVGPNWLGALSPFYQKNGIRSISANVVCHFNYEASDWVQKPFTCKYRTNVYEKKVLNGIFGILNDKLSG
jgi:hypothetical protein